jgi:hypothetical protein
MLVVHGHWTFHVLVYCREIPHDREDHKNVHEPYDAVPYEPNDQKLFHVDDKTHPLHQTNQYQIPDAHDESHAVQVSASEDYPNASSTFHTMNLTFPNQSTESVSSSPDSTEVSPVSSTVLTDP